MSAYFITGTDTGIGKTWATLALMRARQRRGRAVLGMKPVASGCVPGVDGPRNADAQLIMRYASETPGRHIEYAQVNPCAFVPPIAPHIAASQAGARIDMELIARRYDELKAVADDLFVEGIGGWCVPLSDTAMLSDLVRRLDLPVILVVGLRLGCLNHALSTARLIADDGLTLRGWIGSQMVPDLPVLELIMDALGARIPAPLLGRLPYMREFDAVTAVLGLRTRAFSAMK